MEKELLNNELQTLERKLGLMLNEYKMLRAEVNQLKSENSELRTLLKSKDELINGFQNQSKIDKIVNTIETGGEDTSELKEKIDEYIKEIDKCILHLTQ